VGRIISIHEYELKPDVDEATFVQAVQQAQERGLFRLPGLVAHRFVRGIRGHRTGAFAAIWIYASREAWEQLWGPPMQPRPPAEYPENWKIWEAEVLAPFLDRHPDRIRFTAYEELDGQ